MLPSLEKITKFLILEIERNFDNRSVFGGLQKVCQTWKQEALMQGVSIELVNKICEILANYDSLDGNQRDLAIQLIMDKINPQSSSPPIIEPKKEFKTESVNREDKPGNNPVPPPIENEFDIEKALSNPVTNIPGIGNYRAQGLSKLKIFSIKDLIYYFPRKHEDFSNLKTIDSIEFGKTISIATIIKSIHSRNLKGGKQNITEVIIEDDTGSLRVTFFNQPFLSKTLKPGVHIIVSGKIEMYMGRFVLNNPEWIELDKGGVNPNRLFPYYSLTKNITQKWLREIIARQIQMWTPKVSDFFSNTFLEKAEIIDLQTALVNIHFPENNELKKKAEERFAFQDTFFLHLSMLQQKKQWKQVSAKKIKYSKGFYESLIQNLPYSLTKAQSKCISEIREDLVSGVPMSRLIQGDVGSGKTIVAAIIIAGVTTNGFQSAIMAPTSILAEQLFTNIYQFLTTNQIISPEEICFLSGDTPDKEKKQIRAGLANGDIKVAVGTHALIEDPIKFKNLEFVVIDEQHRFGVMQRKKIRSKGESSHLLVMTATPIPRTLALTIYGDLDLSIIDEIPPGRKEIKTTIVKPSLRDQAYHLIKNQINLGFQVFIVYPMVESDDFDLIETNAAINEYFRLKKKNFPDAKMGLLHGRMKSEEKEKVMTDFRTGVFQILVTTTVIEVGVDVPNATIMMIEGANRFGLSQLHQLRGRVGRGLQQSYCLLIPENDDSLENERLKAMIETNDGFKLAEIDLRQRGPGDFIGTRQSGYKEIRFSTIMNVKLIDKARTLAREVIEKDPSFINDESHHFKLIMNEYLQKLIGEKN
jgi:ATP-dependent DNA helicase RecG